MSTLTTNAGPAPIRSSRRRTSQVLLTVALFFVAAGMVAVTSLAVFTDSESVAGNTFTAGTVDLTVAPATAVVTMPAMVPGDQVTAPLTVSNVAGTLDFRYSAISATTEDVLASALVMSIKAGTAPCTDAGFAADASTPIYTGPLGSVATTTLFGSNVQGSQAGDRTLTTGSSEVLCINVSLPLAATTGQGATTTATFTFDAEQTDNNP